jgi:hypothetical protein
MFAIEVGPSRDIAQGWLGICGFAASLGFHFRINHYIVSGRSALRADWRSDPRVEERGAKSPVRIDRSVEIDAKRSM